MNARRTGAIALKVLRTLKHDKRSLALMLVAPLFAMLVFGFVFGAEVEHVPTAIVDEDEGSLAANVTARLDPRIVDVRAVATWEEAKRLVIDGEAKVALRFPANFTAGATPGAGRPPTSGPGGLPVGAAPGEPPSRPAGSEVEVFVDGSNPQLVAAVTRATAEAVQDTLAESGGKAPVTLATQYAYAEDARFMDFFVPGIMTFAGLMFTMLLTLLAFVGERTSGTLPRLLATPLRASELVAGYALAFSVVGVLQATVLLGAALLLFDVLVVGSLALVFVVVALTAVDALSLGILLSAAARREAQAIQLFPVILFPTLLLSGIFVPMESLPSWLQPLAWAIPPTYATDALRAVMLRGWGLDRIVWDLAALVGFAALFLGVAVLGLRRGRAKARG